MVTILLFVLLVLVGLLFVYLGYTFGRSLRAQSVSSRTLPQSRGRYCYGLAEQIRRSSQLARGIIRLN